MKSIKFYSKEDCTPCVMKFNTFEKIFKEEQYEKITLKTEQEALDCLTKYRVKTVPFVVINEKVVLSGTELTLLLYSIKNI